MRKYPTPGQVKKHQYQPVMKMRIPYTEKKEGVNEISWKGNKKSLKESIGNV